MQHRDRNLASARTAISGQQTARIIYIKERNLAMLITDVMKQSPLRLLGDETDDIFMPGKFGAVMAGPGVGKTSLMVQLALYALLSEKSVLHISLNDPVHKVSLWYEEVFKNLAVSTSTIQMQEIWETVQKHRFIMTFQVEGFSVPKLRERLTDLTEQGIFSPQMLIIDGLPFDPPAEDTLSALKKLAVSQNLSAWFTVQTPRNEAVPFGPVPGSIADRFDLMIFLQPDGKEVKITPIKGTRSENKPPELYLDAATMLIHRRGDAA
ncbi:MAG: cytoplasmic protein [Desulfatirhabdiaceae bacterium]